MVLAYLKANGCDPLRNSAFESFECSKTFFSWSASHPKPHIVCHMLTSINGWDSPFTPLWTTDSQLSSVLVLSECHFYGMDLRAPRVLYSSMTLVDFVLQDLRPSGFHSPVSPEVMDMMPSLQMNNSWNFPSVIWQHVSTSNQLAMISFASSAFRIFGYSTWPFLWINLPLKFSNLCRVSSLQPMTRITLLFVTSA